MLEPLSEPIRKLLLELRLCSEIDLRRCRRLVRRLTCDLPAFDSVWLDALVQIGRLTPYQARILESPLPRRLQIGPCVAVNRIGGGLSGQTLLARSHGSYELCVTKIFPASQPLSEEAFERLQNLVQRVKGLAHPSLVGPFSCVRADDQIVLVSRYVAGPHLGELLVRRGRFAAKVTWEIGRQLVAGLEELAQRGVVHGDIRAANVRLTSAGTAVLVDTGVRPAVDAVLTIHSGLPSERYDGIAPELIGGHVPPNALSDAYAIGCLLWQLLAGRPPFPGGDALVKLAAHQTRTIDDVRKWAPDTPPALAEGIRRLTARQPGDRPARLTELLEEWSPPGRSGRKRLADFRRRFDAPARTPRIQHRLSTPTRWLVALAALFALSGTAITLTDRGARNVVLAWTAELSRSITSETTAHEVLTTRRPIKTDENPGAPAEEIDSEINRPLPEPDRYGVVHLDAQGFYRVSDISAVGDLTIVGDGNVPSQIVIDAKPLKLWAESVKLQNVQVAVRGGTAPLTSKLNALVLVQTQSLSIEGCVFDSGAKGAFAASDLSSKTSAPPTGPALVAWKLVDATEKRGATATIRNTLLLGDGPGLYLAHAVRQVEFENVFKLGTSPLVQLATGPAEKSSLLLRFSHTTCRASGALLRWIVPAEGGPPGRILIEADDCVFDVVPVCAALFEFASPRSRPDWLRSVQMTGEGSVATPMEMAAWISTIDGRISPVQSPAIELEGIVTVPIHFAGQLGPRPSDAEVNDPDVPRRTSAPPGIRPAKLPKRS